MRKRHGFTLVELLVVIAIIAIGMTMVIITAGIDLSVGSLIGLSAVIGTVVMKQMGGLEAAAWVVLLGFITGMLACRGGRRCQFNTLVNCQDKRIYKNTY